jgi:glutathione S-transferase
MITLFWCPQTRASRILWLLEEMDQPFEVRMIDIRKPEARAAPDFVAASPMGKVPALMDSGGQGVVRLADSAAIALYLADRYPSAGLAPPVEDPSRGDYLYWMTFTPGVIEPAMMERFNKGAGTGALAPGRALFRCRRAGRLVGVFHEGFRRAARQRCAAGVLRTLSGAAGISDSARPGCGTGSVGVACGSRSYSRDFEARRNHDRG